MIAVDTNVLVRLLVDEPSQPDQIRAARSLAMQAGVIHVSIVALVETVWVLESSYGIKKTRIMDVLSHLLNNEAFPLEAPSRCRAALTIFAETTADFSDCLILAGCSQVDLVLHTFDKRLARLNGARQILN